MMQQKTKYVKVDSRTTIEVSAVIPDHIAIARFLERTKKKEKEKPVEEQEKIEISVPDPENILPTDEILDLPVEEEE
jgi:hypothetical protein